MKKILLYFSVLLFFSCETYSEFVETDKTIKTIDTDKKIVTRKGDSLSIYVPNIKYKDTIIERINYQTRTVARVVYDNKGNQRLDCISAEIKEEIHQIREEIKNNITTESEKENELKPQHFIYALAVLVVVLIIGLIVFYVLVNRLIHLK